MRLNEEVKVTIFIAVDVCAPSCDTRKQAINWYHFNVELSMLWAQSDIPQIMLINQSLGKMVKYSLKRTLYFHHLDLCMYGFVVCEVKSHLNEGLLNKFVKLIKAQFGHKIWYDTEVSQTSK